MRSTKISAVALAGLLSLTLAACGDDDESTATPSSNESSSSSSSAASTEPIAEIADLSNGVSTAVTVDAGFLEGLTALGVTPGVIGTATLTDGVLSFPITGGNVSVFDKAVVDPYITGEIQHNGSGLSLTAGGIKVDLENFVVDPGESVLTGKVSANGEVAAESANLFFLDGSTLQPVRTEGTNAIVEGTTVKLHPDAAQLLRDTYGVTAEQLPDFFTVGIAKITAATQ